MNSSVAELDRFLRGVEQRALRMARFALGDPDEALDAVQDAMLSLARRYGRRPGEEWPPLFHRILQNRIRDGWRRRAVRARFAGRPGPKTDGEDTGEDAFERIPAPATADPVRAAAGRAAMMALSAAVSALPPRQREAFTLRVLEACDVAETARLMGCSEGSVKVHLHRATQALRTVLEAHYE